MIIDCWKLEQAKWAQCLEWMQAIKAEATLWSAIVSEPWQLIVLAALTVIVLEYLIVAVNGRSGI